MGVVCPDRKVEIFDIIECRTLEPRGPHKVRAAFFRPWRTAGRVESAGRYRASRAAGGAMGADISICGAIHANH